MSVAAIELAVLSGKRLGLRQMNAAMGARHHRLRLNLRARLFARPADSAPRVQNEENDGADDQRPKKELHIPPRCSTTSSTKRVPT